MTRASSFQQNESARQMPTGICQTGAHTTVLSGQEQDFFSCQPLDLNQNEHFSDRPLHNRRGRILESKQPGEEV